MSVTYAEDVNYWKSSRTAPDTWLQKSIKEIETIGGQVLAEGFMSESHYSAFMLAFELNGDRFKLLWPVLQSKTSHEAAARIQAATALYHEVKAACVKAKFLGSRPAFLSYLMLPDGRTAAQASSN